MLEFHFTIPYTGKVDFHPGNMPKVLGIGAVVVCNNILFVLRNTFRRETLRLKFSLMTWRGHLPLEARKGSILHVVVKTQRFVLVTGVILY